MKTDQSCCQAKELQLEQSEEPGWSIKVDNTKVSKRFITSDMSIFMTVLGKWDPLVDFYLFQILPVKDYAVLGKLLYAWFLWP